MEQKKRRKFTPEFKLQVLQEALEKELIEELLKKKAFSISEKKLIIKNCQLTNKYPIKLIREKLNVSKSMIYHIASNKKRGAKLSKTTPHKDRGNVANKVVIEQLKVYLNNTNFCKYGYKNCESVLKDNGYIINHKKLYRLMKSESLLLNKQPYRNNKRHFVSHRKIQTQKPLQYICMDITQFYLSKENKKVFFLACIDVHTRALLGFKIGYSMKHDKVIEMLRELLKCYPIDKVFLRNDNGSQFIAHKVREYIKSYNTRIYPLCNTRGERIYRKSFQHI